MLKNQIDDSAWAYVEMVLEEIEKSVPYQQIYIDKSQNRIDEEYTQEEISDIRSKAELLIAIAKAAGNDDIASVINALFSSEPFCKCPDLKQTLMEEYR